MTIDKADMDKVKAGFCVYPGCTNASAPGSLYCDGPPSFVAVAGADEQPDDPFDFLDWS